MSTTRACGASQEPTEAPAMPAPMMMTSAACIVLLRPASSAPNAPLELAPVHRYGVRPTMCHVTSNPMLANDLVATLKTVSTGTITTILLKKGLRRTWMRGPKPLADNARIVGEAFTMRFVPAREDLATPESWASPHSTRAAIEDMPAGVVAVADAMGVAEAGIFGD